MRFQKTTEYAIRIMVYLAEQNKPVCSVQHLHTVLKIPRKYLSRLMHLLSEAGFVEVVMGKYGGYRIHPHKRDPYLYEIVGAIEGLDSYNRCILGFETCSDENPCSLHTYWLKYQQGLKEMIYNISLEDLELEGQTKY